MRLTLEAGLVLVACLASAACARDAARSEVRSGRMLAGADRLASIAKVIVPVRGGIAEYAQGEPVALLQADGTTPVTEDNLDLLRLPGYGDRLRLTGLPSGTITQLRLFLDGAARVVLQDGSEQPLGVPSGGETGIKIVGPFEASVRQTDGRWQVAR